MSIIQPRPIKISHALFTSGSTVWPRRTHWLLASLLIVMPVASTPASDDTIERPKEPVLESVQRMLQPYPMLARYLFSTLDVDETGHSPFVGGPKAPEALRGTRLGPYTLYARPKGTQGGAQFLVRVDTERSFVDAAGKSTEYSEASAVTEQFKTLSLVPLLPVDGRLVGTWRVEAVQPPWDAIYKQLEWSFRSDLSYRSQYVTTDTAAGVEEGHYQAYEPGIVFVGSRERNIWTSYRISFESNDRMVAEHVDPKTGSTDVEAGFKAHFVRVGDSN